MPDNRGFKDYDTVRDLDARFAEEDRQGSLVRANCADLAEIEPRTWGLGVAR